MNECIHIYVQKANRAVRRLREVPMRVQGLLENARAELLQVRALLDMKAELGDACFRAKRRVRTLERAVEQLEVLVRRLEPVQVVMRKQLDD